ncbi:hypothetical protein [Stomatohabitans albus]|uniref:hypothetical protein n=1 Tax=Stomatohabitans albus TaxID=3110766 RepID=UPI00300C0CBA
MPDSPERQVPPPPSDSGVVPIPGARPAPRTSLRRPPLSSNERASAVPPKPKTQQRPGVLPGDVEAASPDQVPTKPSPGPRQSRRQPLGRSRAGSQRQERNTRERLERLVARQGTPPSSPSARVSSGSTGESVRHEQDTQAPQPPVPDSHSSRLLQSPKSPAQRVRPPVRPTTPVVPEPPQHRAQPQSQARVPEPPARDQIPTISRRRPPNRLLAALDAQLDADQQALTKAKWETQRRPVPQQRPSPRRQGRAPLSHRAPAPSASTEVGGTQTPLDLPDPTVPPAPVVPFASSPEPEPDRPHEIVDTASVPSSQQKDDPLADSYERLLKAARRQQALHAETASEPGEQVPDAQASGPETVTPDNGKLHTAQQGILHDAADDRGVPPHDDHSDVAVHDEDARPRDHDEESEQAPSSDQPLSDHTDVTLFPTQARSTDGAANVVPLPPDEDSDTAQDSESMQVIPLDSSPRVTTMGTGDNADIDHDEATIVGGLEIEDAEIVTEPEVDDESSLLDRPLDLVQHPEHVEIIEPETVSVEDTVFEHHVDETEVDQALADAPPYIPPTELPAEEPETIIDPPATNRGFRVLTGILILVIFALVCIAVYRLAIRPNQPTPTSTPTPIVPTSSSSEIEATPLRPAQTSEAPPVPALPPRKPLPSDAAIPPALPGQVTQPEVTSNTGSIAIGTRVVTLPRINQVNLLRLVTQPVAGEDVQIQSVLAQGAHIWLGTDQDHRILAIVPEPFRETLQQVQVGDHVDFIGTLVEANEPEIIGPEQGRDRLIRQGAAIEVRDITVRNAQPGT